MENLETLEGSVVLPAEQPEPAVSGDGKAFFGQGQELEEKALEQVKNDRKEIASLEKEANALLAEKEAGHLTTLRKKMLENDLHRIRLRQQELVAYLRESSPVLIKNIIVDIQQEISQKQDELERLKKEAGDDPLDQPLSLECRMAAVRKELVELGAMFSRLSFAEKDIKGAEEILDSVKQ